ncbi:nitrous oxide reductase accessory protein NosL [Rhodobacter sp. JA431]|uniref:nitrous oxide reductase accessory protein NosL n=1 Tax=Rhodobacter sp. JA431 TaxID=570013 RepID=UPI000BDA5159|nr:nitrous oxide reductase accessory protein NosL [Rhodobacter sp. JA431]SOB99436.1 nitrous oxide reductase accessory protein NosL [Rhodobacter sp. JA431]
MCTISRPNRRTTLALLLGASALPLAPRAARAKATAIDLPPPGPRDTCPVCGMFVARYPDWVATIQFADGEAVHFDGAKDFFKFLHDPGKYATGRTREQITGMGVSDYYEVALVDAREAVYAVGSDVLGPMGHEFVPLASDADATDFMADHKGQRLLRFDEVTPDLPFKLDEGAFE